MYIYVEVEGHGKIIIGRQIRGMGEHLEYELAQVKQVRKTEAQRRFDALVYIED